MNGFLVMARYNDADMPVRLFASSQEAEDFARSLTPEDLDVAAEVLYHVSGKPRFVYLVEMFEGVPSGARQLKRLP